MPTLDDRFRGCLAGAAIGDMIGAVVEAESPQFIESQFRSIDDLLAVRAAPEFNGPDWQVGRFTDDTQMMLCVAQWLVEDPSHAPENLLARFAAAYEPWRRYGPSTAAILRMYNANPTEWRQLATAMFPWGSFGNGSSMRVAPVGLAYRGNEGKVIEVATASSRPTHSHPLAYQGAMLQAIAVSTAVTASDITVEGFLRPLRQGLHWWAENLQDTSKFGDALNAIELGLQRGTDCRTASETLGTEVAAYESVPMALYCFLSHPHSYVQVIREAVFIGGDTDTIASMAGAISGAFLGVSAIPQRWLEAVRDERYPADGILQLGDQLCDAYRSRWWPPSGSRW